VAKIDINMDDIVEDARRECEVMLLAWQGQGTRGGIFRPAPGDFSSSETSSEYYTQTGSSPEHNLLRVVVGDLGKQIQSDTAERQRQRIRGMEGSSVPRHIRTSGSEMYASEGTPLLGSAGIGFRRESSGISPGTVSGKDYMSASTGSQGQIYPGGASGPRITWDLADGGKSGKNEEEDD
jgi:hypothetical protein